jgi:hypothetical protein
MLIFCHNYHSPAWQNYNKIPLRWAADQLQITKLADFHQVFVMFLEI